MLREGMRPTGYVHEKGRVRFKPLVSACDVRVGDTVRHGGEDWLVDDVDRWQFSVVLYTGGFGRRFDNSDELWLVAESAGTAE